MKKIDIILSIVCGLAVAWVASDFFSKYTSIFYIALPLLSIIGLWVSELIGKRFLSIYQSGKFVLVGAFADVIDIKVFQMLILLAPFSLVFKAVSFLLATAIKYLTNKHWVFEKHDGNETIKFFLVTIVGLTIDVVSFYYLKNIQIGISASLWLELSIIFAALITAVWNFLGYKL